ncbi:ABC transporter ATP-binding protein [Pontibacter ramchanderi]|uniref:ABC-2 type transport system ATP-binding protein n=1 Tax=Pontibacter ramchanderi TaxID=1179743 RepID=A0A2N3U8H7_9BACT|nr:ABC transporter ATP-binding protein [Pontibacter ramchanderi]PKV63058.1 ABC-2 type transport system ATP-binding protein [Pontibacter ramchanderi]
MIQIENLSFGYSRKSLLFRNLNLRLQEGHIYGLLGKNGAGKSTLLKNMVGLVSPMEGSCRVNGLEASKRFPAMLEDLYFIPEEIYTPSLTARQFVANTAPFYPLFDEEAFYRYLSEFDVPQQEVFSKMSFGQQKKAIIAFGLATNTSVLIMDEPTNGLDIPSKVQFRRIIASALTEHRCIIISTHQVRDLDSLIDTLVVVHDREIVLNESLDTISERLSFTTIPETEAQNALYTEDALRGKNAILPNLMGNYSKVDMELLFNAITSGNTSVTEILKRPHYEQSF